MNKKDDFKKLAAKCIENDDFRRDFEKDPTKTAQTIGITLEEETAKKIKEKMKTNPPVTDGFVSHVVSSF
ncbi:hypothetical protein OAT16_04315 [Prolixibacteraceae bacterium]|nr:hypothetical protein [Prolixibacteraceae bacterium]